MERKFTDDEIVELLKMWSDTRCDKMCTFVQGDIFCSCCIMPVIKAAIYLINRYKAENSNLTSDLTSLQNDLTSAKAEIERLRSIVNADIIGIGRCNGKTEKAKQIVRIRMNEVKAEAIKEFAEKLKKEACYPYVESDMRIVTVDDIDNLVKEMTGEGAE